MSVHEPRLFTEENPDDPDEKVDVWMDGEVIMTVTYNELGWSGMQKVKHLVELIAREM